MNIFFQILSNLYTQCEAWTHNLKIKSNWASQALKFLNKLICNKMLPVLECGTLNNSEHQEQT